MAGFFALKLVKRTYQKVQTCEKLDDGRWAFGEDYVATGVDGLMVGSPEYPEFGKKAVCRPQNGVPIFEWVNGKKVAKRGRQPVKLCVNGFHAFYAKHALDKFQREVDYLTEFPSYFYGGEWELWLVKLDGDVDYDQHKVAFRNMTPLMPLTPFQARALVAHYTDVGNALLDDSLRNGYRQGHFLKTEAVRPKRGQQGGVRYVSVPKTDDEMLEHTRQLTRYAARSAGVRATEQLRQYRGAGRRTKAFPFLFAPFQVTEAIEADAARAAAK